VSSKGGKNVSAVLETLRPSQQVRKLSRAIPGATTDELLHNLLDNLASILRAKRAYVTRIIDPTRSRTMASWEDGRRGPVREYRIGGTPCEAVIRHGVQVVDCELAARYQMDEFSLGHGCESFVGSPILDHDGERIGQLCVFGARALNDPEMAGALVSLAAVRVSAELEHRAHEAKLNDERRRLEVLLGNLPGMAYRSDYDPERTMRFASEGCEALTGFTPEELGAGKKYWCSLVHRDDRGFVREAVVGAVTQGRPFEIQYRILTRDGTQKWVWERGCGVANERGTVRWLEGFISDATALKDSEAALARSEAYSSAIVATAAEGIITLDARGVIESANEALEEMFGYERGELLGQLVQVLVPEPYRGQHAVHLEHYAATGKASIMGTGREVPAQRKDGTIFPIYLAASEISVDGEKRFAGIVRDISEQKVAEDSLRSAERRFRAVFDQQYQLAGILSTTGEVLEANEKSLEFAGLDGDKVIGRKFWDTPWWEHSSELQSRMREAVRAAAAGGTERFEATCKCAGAHLATLDVSIRPIKDKSGKVVFLVTESRDITEQKLAEEEARQHRERIAHVSRLSTLGEMAAGIAHEINQPLTAISLFAQAGRRLIETGNLAKMGEVCTKLNEHALRASDVVERMQTMARQGETLKEVVDCNDLIESAVRLAESEARINDIRIDFEKGDRLPRVSVDGVQIQQVALNLLRNAMEATLGNDDRAEKSVQIATRTSDDENVEIVVIDRGGGVPEDRIDKLFTPFSTTKKSGMGMGLSISQAIVRAHGGSIGFRNNDVGGATFSFTLPAAIREHTDGRKADSIRR
jgi:two-component system sensor kinase FixL